MNAKIKLSLFALAGVSLLASCGDSGTTLTRAQAETELDSYASHAQTPTKVTYKDVTIGKNPTKSTKAGTAKSSMILDSAAVYAYRHFDEETGDFPAGSSYYAYKTAEGKYFVGSVVGSTKTYYETIETVVKGIITAGIGALKTYADSQASGTSYWLKGFDKSEKWIADNSKDKDNTETYGQGYGGGTVYGYIKSESYKKYADGKMKADITAMYPFQADMVSMGGENCIYEWENYQLTRLYNNYQDYEETFDWTNTVATDMPIDANTWTKGVAVLTGTVTAAMICNAHAYSD